MCIVDQPTDACKGLRESKEIDRPINPIVDPHAGPIDRCAIGRGLECLSMTFYRWTDGPLRVRMSLADVLPMDRWAFGG